MGYLAGYYDIKMNEPDKTLSVKLGLEYLCTPVKAVTGFLLESFCCFDCDLLLPLIGFMADVSHPVNMAAASISRFGCKRPDYPPAFSEEFEEFAKMWIIRNVRALVDQDIPSWETWLADTSYNGPRKKALDKLKNELKEHNKKVAISKSFIKNEIYLEPKQPRAINSPSDESKVLLAPLIKAIDKRLYSTGFFVKGTNPRDWPKKLKDLFGETDVIGTDFSSFEAHHHGVMSHIVHFWVMHSMRGLSGNKYIRTLLSQMMLGRNVVEFKHLNVKIHQRLMSGALWTSSANGLLNLLILSYLSSKKKFPNSSLDARVLWASTKFKILVEGDDGIAEDVGLTEADSLACGISLKIDRAGVTKNGARKGNFAETGFCGILCNYDSMVVIKDPVSVILKFFVLPTKYKDAKKGVKLALLRARAMSYLVNFSECPVIGSLARSVCRLTKGIDDRRARSVFSSYELATYEIARVEKPWMKVVIPSNSSRNIVSEKFGMSPSRQEDLERIFDEAKSGRFLINIRDLINDKLLEHSRTFTTKDFSAWRHPEYTLKGNLHVAMRKGLKGVKAPGDDAWSKALEDHPPGFDE